MYKTYYKPKTSKVKVLFLHGFNSNGNFVIPLINSNPNFEIISFDFPGSGKNETDSPVSIESYKYYTISIIEKINEPLIIIGHSLGGAIANAISTHPLVKGVILLAPLNPFIHKLNNTLQKWLLPNNIEQAVDSLEHLVFNKEKSIYFNNLGNSAQTFLKNVLPKFNIFSNMVKTQILNPDYLNNELKNYYTNNKKKTLIIQGDKDFFVTWDSSNKTANHFKWQLNTIANTGHSIIFERPNEVTKIINNYLKVI